MDSIFVSELEKFDVSHDLHVDNSKIIINSLVEYHMINKLLDLFPFSSDSLDAVHVNVLKQLVNLLVTMYFMNQSPQELNQGLIVVLNAEEKAVEQSHWILLDVS